MSSAYISKEKKSELEKELDFLRATKRKEIAENIQKARALGDLSENAEYHAAREEQGFMEDRIKEIEHTLKFAKVVDLKNSKSGVVSVGSNVEIKKKGDSGRWESKGKMVQIVGSEESDVLSGKIAYDSPLGSALMGQTEGVEILVSTPRGDVNYKIVSVG